MENTKNLKTRVLALVLTALMIVGVLPMAIYGVNGTQELVENSFTNTYKKPYTPEELEAELAKTDGELVLGQTFEEMTASELSQDKADTTTVGTGDVERRAGASAIVEDPLGNGKVLAYKFNTSSKYKISINQHTQPKGNGKADLENTGKSFVWSADIMLGEYWVKRAFEFYSYQEDGVSGTSIVGKPLYLGSDGILYYGGAATAGNEIVELSKTEYTNIAIHVNVVDNKYDVYVNGEKVVSNITFLADTELAKIDEEKLPKGFALSTVSFYQETSTADANGAVAFYLDNLAIYFNESYLGMKTVTEFDAYDDETDTGYKAENGGIYYYVNGEIVGNTVTPDGILTIDENGQVFCGETAVTNMGEIYKFVGTDLVPVDGVYSGSYQANILVGATNGNLYYYDEDGKRVVDQTCYAIDGVPYVIDANGIVDGYTGIYNNKYYVDSVAQKNGLVNVGEDIYYAGEDGTFITGEKEIGGKIWDFDATTFEGAIRDGLWIVNEGTADEYANLYIDGVLQTEDSAESFATANPFTYKGKTYYIEPDASVDGQANLYKGSEIVNINGLPYTFAGYICAMVQETVFDGKYYDAEGNVVKEALFEGKNNAGETVWYHADTETGDLIVLGTDIATLIGDKWFVSAVAENEPYIIKLANGVLITEDGEYRLYEDGVIFTGSSKELNGFTVVVKNDDGDLGTNEYTDRPDCFGGKWYVKGGEYAYELVYANGMLVTSDKAPEEEANEHKLFENGVVNYGDVNGEFLDGGVLVNKYSPKGSLYYNYVDGVLAADGKTYDFEGYVAVLRDNYLESNDGFVWVNGYKVEDGIHKVPVAGGDPVQMHFKGGKAAAGEVVQSDGSVLAFGEDGKRIVFEGDNEPVAKYPHSIIIITQLKDGTRLAKRDLYRFWNTSYTYVPYYECYGYTITIDGVEVTAAEGEILKVFIEASDENDHLIVVTFDTSVDYHNYVRVDEECEAATCVLGGTDVYVCNTCKRGGKKTVNTEIDPNNHNLFTEETQATHTSMGVITKVCDNGCGYCEYEYTPMEAHTWDEGERVEPGCGTTGSVQYSCACGATKTDTLAATGVHSYVVSAKVDPTCVVDGAIYYVCSDCENTYTVKIPATGIHTHGEYDSYTVIEDVTKGLETRVYNCNTCGAIGVINKTVEVDEED